MLERVLDAYRRVAEGAESDEQIERGWCARIHGCTRRNWTVKPSWIRSSLSAWPSGLCDTLAVTDDVVPLRVKVSFALEQDEDGYPGVPVESVWARRSLPDGYVIENIPFFARTATLGDRIAVAQRDGALWFERVLQRSGSSLLRVVPFDPARRAELRDRLVALGCSSELSTYPNIIAVDVPASASLRAVQAYLSECALDDWLGYEEAILRQD